MAFLNDDLSIERPLIVTARIWPLPQTSLDVFNGK
jgi:hypothetical protein